MTAPAYGTIVYKRGRFFVALDIFGYYNVWRVGAVSPVAGYSGDAGLAKAKAECAARNAAVSPWLGVR